MLTTALPCTAPPPRRRQGFCLLAGSVSGVWDAELAVERFKVEFEAFECFLQVCGDFGAGGQGMHLVLQPGERKKFAVRVSNLTSAPASGRIEPVAVIPTITVIEGDHGSCYFHPETKEAVRAWNYLIEVQAALGGNSLIGRQLYPLLAQAGFREVGVSPRVVYCDLSRPE